MLERLMRLPLLYKILLANSAIVALGAVAGTVITAWHVRSFPDDPHYELIAMFATAGLGISFVVNYVVLRLALTPLDRLQKAVDQVQRGRQDVRVESAATDDERFERLGATFNQMLATVEEDERKLHQLSQDLLQAQEEERRRVARELHDEAAQALTSLLVRLRLLERSSTPEQARQYVQELRKLTAQALEDIRKVALELRPTILDDLGLGEALSWRVDELNAPETLKATLQISSLNERLPRELELTFYRVAQEALNNSARHAQASHIQVSLRREGDKLALEIQDDGKGFEVTRAASGARHGLGLPGMRERLALVGGALTVESKPGKGTRILACAPIPNPESAKEQI